MLRVVMMLCCLSVAGCNTPAAITLPSGDTLEAGKLAVQELSELPPAQERIRIGDILRIVRTSGEMPSVSAFTANSIYELTLYTVMNDGTFQYPFIGTVEALGKTPVQLAEEISKRQAAYYQDPRVTLNINQSPSNTVFVGGSVRTPQPLPLPAAPTLEQAIIGAGGVMIDADSRNVALLRLNEHSQYQTYFVDYAKLMHGGVDGRSAIALQRGDVVFVPKSGVGNRVEGVELYINQLIPFVKTLGVGFNYDLRKN